MHHRQFKLGRLDFFYELDVLMEVGLTLATTRPSWGWATPRLYQLVLKNGLPYRLFTHKTFPQKVAATALRQANNSLGQAVQLLQEQPDLIQVKYFLIDTLEIQVLN